MFVASEDQELAPLDWFDPFPEPRTIPSGWDLGGLFPEPRTAVVADEPEKADPGVSLAPSA